jgi:hypothetical protein
VPVLPEIVSFALAGTVFGMSVGASQALRLRPRDLILRRYHRLRETAQGELAQVLDALTREYVKLDRYLQGRSLLGIGERRQLTQRVDGLTDQVLDAAERASLLEHELTRLRPEDLEHRTLEVQRRLDGTGDESVRQQYVQVLENLREQERHYRELECARDRLLSRLTNFLTSLQSLYLSLVNLEVSDRDPALEPELLAGEGLRQAADEVEQLRHLAAEMSLRRRLEALPADVRSLRPAD